MIKAIIFDLSEVLLTGFKETELEIEKIVGQRWEDVHKNLHGEEMNLFFIGKLSEEVMIKKIIDKNNIPLTLTEFKRTIRNNFKEIEGTREIILELKKMNFKIGLLSVHGKEWVDHCEKKFNYHKFFNPIVYSFETSLCKPDKKSYTHILNLMSARPEETLFIDDSKTNIASAKELGINTILFKTPEQLRLELKNFDINL